jgi:SAM-dependent methyltransferase
MQQDDEPPRVASVLLHPSASTPQARLAPEERRKAFVAELDRLERGFLAGENPYQLAGEVYETAWRFVPEGNPQAISELRELAAGHRIQTFLRQCPLTRLAQDAPRDPFGVPELIDALQSPAERHAMVASATPIGQAILLRLLDTPGAAAVRARRSLIATHIAAVAREMDGARILAVGCGHAGELDLVPEDAKRRILSFVGIDSGAAALAVASRQVVGSGPITTRQMAPQKLGDDPELTGFDLIYSAGLCTYLPDRACRQLTRDLFRRLAPGGQLLIGNVLPGEPGLGYREVFMRWSMNARDREQILDFARGIARADIAREDVLVEPNGCIGLLELVRA